MIATILRVNHQSFPTSRMTDISSVIDSFFFVYIVTLVLFGITIVQTWIYAHKNNDRWTLRIFVTGLVLLDLMETVSSTQLVHHYLISHFGDTDALKFPTSMISVDFAITSITFFMVHLFFAYRLWKLGESWYLPAIITFTSTAMLGLGVSAVYEQILGHLTFLDYQQHHKLIELAIFHTLAVVTDVLITIGLSWTLSTTHTGFKNTRTVLQRILAFTVTRGILVCIVQIGHIIMYTLNPRNMLFWISLHLALTKIYTLTTLVTLNSRRSLRDKLQEVNLDNFHISFAHSTYSPSDGDVEAARRPEGSSATKTHIDSLVVRAHGVESSENVAA